MYEIHNLTAEPLYLKSYRQKWKTADINYTNPEKIILQNRLSLRIPCSINKPETGNRKQIKNLNFQTKIQNPLQTEVLLK